MPSREEIIDELEAFEVTLSNAKTKRSLGAVKTDLDTLLANVRALKTTVDESKLAKIEDFFHAVGKGAREAQKKLDTESEIYMQERPDFAPQTMFRVPKVSANLKLGMTNVSRESIDFFVYERTSEQREYLEQEISFDIVTAMPPPDALEDLSNLPLGQIVASNPADRKQVKERLEAERERQQGLPNGDKSIIWAIDRILDDGAFRRTLLFRPPEFDILVLIAPAGPIASAPPEKNCIQLLAPHDRDALWVARPIHERASPDMRPLIRALMPIAVRQEQLLKDLGRE